MILTGDARRLVQLIPDNSVDCIITSPPYWGLRDYGHARQIGLEPTIDHYINDLSTLLFTCASKLKPTGGMWLVLGDAYAGSCKAATNGKNLHTKKRYKPVTSLSCTDTVSRKSLYLTPERLGLALIEKGLILRNKIIWYKRNAKPEAVKDRCVTDYETVLFFTTQAQGYYYQPQRQGGHLMRSVWDIPTQKLNYAHTAAYPVTLVKRIISLQCPQNGLVFDPFTGSGTTGLACVQTGRRFCGVELNPNYSRMATKRICNEQPRFKF